MPITLPRGKQYASALGAPVVAKTSALRAAPYQGNRVYRRRNVKGRLVVAPHLTPESLKILNSGAQFVGNTVSIAFPSMPDTIDLVRRANYNVVSTFTLPDGFHQYKGTDPLSIPLSFEVHAFDREFCPQGGLSLLDIAAMMHALTLPISTEDTLITTTSAGAAVPSNVAQTNDANVANKAGTATPNTVTVTGGEKSTYFPVPVLLDLIYTGANSPGVHCIGYVNEVATKFHGPWLSGGSTNARNLPSKLTVNFTFVHRPSHTNRFSNDQTASNIRQQHVQAFADTVKNRLYNTRSLVKSVSYQGFNT